MTRNSLNICIIAFAKIFDNAFRGTLPDTLSQWTALSDFEIEMNAFSGTLPAIIGSSWTQMDTFTVNENMLSGTIPSSVGNWSKVRFFWIADNLIDGTLPDTIGEWKALESFDVRFSWLRRVRRDAFNSAHR